MTIGVLRLPAWTDMVFLRTEVCNQVNRLHRYAVSVTCQAGLGRVIRCRSVGAD
jgi:hypothetical protein